MNTVAIILMILSASIYLFFWRSMDEKLRLSQRENLADASKYGSVLHFMFCIFTLTEMETNQHFWFPWFQTLVLPTLFGLLMGSTVPLTIALKRKIEKVFPKTIIRLKKWRQARGYKKARSREKIIERCKAGIVRARKCYEGDDSVAFLTAAYKLVDMLEQAFERLYKLDTQLQASSANIMQANEIFEEDIGDTLGSFPDRLKRDRHLLGQLQTQLKRVIQGVVFVCDNLWIAASTTAVKKEAQATLELQEAVKELMERLQIHAVADGSLGDFESQRVHVHLASLMSGIDGAGPEEDGVSDNNTVPPAREAASD